MTDETNAVETTEVEDETAAPAKAEKPQLFKIYMDSEGNEIERKPLTRGKHPANSTKDEAGNLIVTVLPKSKPVDAFYITLHEDGTEISREHRGVTRGRPKKGFEKQTDGDNAGHYVKVVTQAELDAEAATAEAEANKPLTQDAPPVVQANVETEVDAEVEVEVAT